jgi:ABC-type antimicrobial peptide transport system permease subunit
MFKSYITIAVRHLVKNKLFSIINILCLAAGITFSMLIGVFVLDEESVNADIKNINSQYIIKSKWKSDNMGIDITTLGPLAKTMKDEYPSLVANYYRFDPVVNIVSVGDKHFRTQISAGDTTLVAMFGLPLLHGNAKQAFTNNQSAMVTEDFAHKFFERTDVVGKVITIQTPADGNTHNFIISAVLKNSPGNTVTNFTGAPYDVYLPMDANQYFQGGDKGDNWANVYMASMLELKPGVTPKDLEKAFAHILPKYQPPFVKGNLQVQLAPMADYYLKGVQNTLTTLSLIAVFILLLATINFININIGTSANRLKEIGLRKVFGGAKLQLVVQYITEALVISFIAAVISLGLYEALLPAFNAVLQTTLNHFWQFNIGKMLFLLLLVISVGLLSGVYPAFVLSASNTINAIKGKIDSAKGGLVLRKILLVVQFTLAIFVFICALNVSKQVAYFFKRDVGYDKDQVVVISSLPRQWDSAGVVKMESFKSRLLQIPGMKNAALSYEIPDGNSGGNVPLSSNNSTNIINMMFMTVDEDFAIVYGLTLTEGIFLRRKGAPYLQGQVVLNESALRALNLTHPVVGKRLVFGGVGGITMTIAGVVKDFNLESLQKKVQPLVMANVNEPMTRAYRYYSVKINTGNTAGTLDALQAAWKSKFPDAGFEYSFMDEKFRAIYVSELQLKKAASIATGLNLVIVFMGIFGVVAFTLAKRTKEIAMRKVLGATVKDIITIFLKEYGLLILLSNIIAWPIAYILTNKWLETYTYRMGQDVTPYLFVCGFIFLAAFILIAAQCYKTAVANPVKALRSE